MAPVKPAVTKLAVAEKHVARRSVLIRFEGAAFHQIQMPELVRFRYEKLADLRVFPIALHCPIHHDLTWEPTQRVHRTSLSHGRYVRKSQQRIGCCGINRGQPQEPGPLMF